MGDGRPGWGGGCGGGDKAEAIKGLSWYLEGSTDVAKEEEMDKGVGGGGGGVCEHGNQGYGRQGVSTHRSRGNHGNHGVVGNQTN